MRLNLLCGSAVAALADLPSRGLRAGDCNTGDYSDRPPPSHARWRDIVVTGFRASLEKALDAKLKADHIQDTLVAEDIGKLPDQNIAEAIERIPGVIVSTATVNGSGQSAGEPTEISVRGFSPEFATALYNGRVLATDSGGREFDFDVLPADLIARVDVSKSSTADQPEGGIAATVNMMTFRPLDLKQNTFTLSAQGNYDQQRGNVTPQASALFSTKTADGRFGILAAVSYINRKVENQRIYSACMNSPSNVTVGGQTVSGFRSLLHRMGSQSDQP